MNSRVTVLLTLIAVLSVGLAISHAQSLHSTFSIQPYEQYSPVSSLNNTVIITTGINGIDSFSAYPLANLRGIPIISINGTLISQALVDNLTSQGITTAIVLGGPKVLSNATISTLENAGINVTRIWGITAPETTLDTINYLVPSPAFKCAVFAFYNESPGFDYPYQFAAALTAARNKCVLFPTYFNNVPSYVLSYLQQHSIYNVTFIGPAQLPSAVFANLTGVSLKNVIGNSTYMQNYVFSLRQARPERMLIVGVNKAAWNASMALGSLPSTNSSMALVSNVSAQMPSIVNEIETQNITEVSVVGIPTLVTQIGSYLTSAGINFSSYGGNGENLMRQVMSKFKVKIQSERRYYNGEFNASVNASTVRGLINDALQRLYYYNNTLATLSVQNGTNISGVQNALRQAYSLILSSNSSVNAGNMTLAIRQLQQAKAQINEALYYSEVRKGFVNDSVGNSVRNVAENTRELLNRINEQMAQINRTLSTWSNSSAFSNASLQIRQRVALIQSTIAQIRQCAADNNLTCLEQVGQKLRADTQSTIYNEVHENFTRRAGLPQGLTHLPR